MLSMKQFRMDIHNKMTSVFKEKQVLAFYTFSLKDYQGQIFQWYEDRIN